MLLLPAGSFTSAQVGVGQDEHKCQEKQSFFHHKYTIFSTAVLSRCALNEPIWEIVFGCFEIVVPAALFSSLLRCPCAHIFFSQVLFYVNAGATDADAFAKFVSVCQKAEAIGVRLLKNVIIINNNIKAHW